MNRKALLKELDAQKERIIGAVKRKATDDIIIDDHKKLRRDIRNGLTYNFSKNSTQN